MWTRESPAHSLSRMLDAGHPETLGGQARFHPSPPAPTHSDHLPGLPPSSVPLTSTLCFSPVLALLPSFELSIVRILLTYITKISRDMSTFRKSWIQGFDQRHQNLLHHLVLLSSLLLSSLAPTALDFHLHCSATQS